MMTAKKHPPTKDRCDIGQVVFPIEKMAVARDLRSCCVGVEAALETNSGLAEFVKRLPRRDTAKNATSRPASE